MYLLQKQFLKKILRSWLSSTEAGEFVCAAQLDVECCAASLISFKHPALGGHALPQTCGMQMCAGVKQITLSRCCGSLPGCGEQKLFQGLSGAPGVHWGAPWHEGNAPPTQVQPEKPPRHGVTSACGTLPHSSPSPSLSNKHFLVSADFLAVCQNHTASELYGKCLMSRTHLSLS